jgi:predicted transcriptional regulator
MLKIKRTFEDSETFHNKRFKTEQFNNINIKSIIDKLELLENRLTKLEKKINELFPDRPQFDFYS